MIQVIGLRLRLWLEGLGALWRFLWQAARRWRSGTIADWLATTPAQRLAFQVLRAFKPNLLLRRKLINAYSNTGTALVTLHQDVCEVLEREADFEVVYEPRMRQITAGENFFSRHAGQCRLQP